jgi:hypothetical protein
MVLKQNEQLSEVEPIVSDEIDSDKKDTFVPFREPDTTTEQMSNAEFLSHIVIEGTPELQQGIKTLLIVLIYFICEVYLDGVIIFGDNTKEFFDRL